jgi:hypothetical protein
MELGEARYLRAHAYPCCNSSKDIFSGLKTI